MAEPARPAAPAVSALPGRLARGGAAALIRALDHLLEQNDWARARLAMHVGRHVVIGVDAPALPGLPPPRIVATIVDGGRLKPADDPGSAEPAVTMLLRPSFEAAFDFARGGSRGLSRHLRLDGDVMLAGALGEIAQHLRWDAVEDLSRFTGDAAADRIASVAGGSVDALRDVGTRLEADAARYLAVESAQLVDRGTLDMFAAQIDALERRLDRLASRMSASK